jgi:pyruvate/2-oxoglutarate dehydrogenase complex dihydrolipoamide acyltransferase (E2) component
VVTRAAIDRLEIPMSMSLRAYARHRGVALSAVQKAIATGRIHPEPDGSIDPAKADAQWDRHTRTAQPTTPRVTTARPPPVAQHASQPASQPAAPPPMPQASDDARGVDYHKARAVRETYSARLAKLEFEERTGKLISKDEVDIKYFQLARQLRDRMQQIPRKVAPEIVALVVADPDVRGVTDILDVAIREALEDLAR